MVLFDYGEEISFRKKWIGEFLHTFFSDMATEHANVNIYMYTQKVCACEIPRSFCFFSYRLWRSLVWKTIEIW